jgi:hypothetical protein
MQNELSERIRTGLIATLAWSNCRTTFDSEADALNLHAEYPQAVGEIVYMGVRTFYDDALLRSYSPDPGGSYLRLRSSPASIGHFFGLDEDEFRLLRRIDPESPIGALIDTAQVEPSHVLSLLALLRMGDFCDIASTPFTQVPEPERSGTRPAPTPPRGNSAPLTRPRSQTAMPAVQAARSTSQAGMPATSAAPAARAAREISGPSRTASQSRMAALPSPPSSPTDGGTRRTPESNADARLPAPPSAAAPNSTQEALREAAARASSHGRRVPPPARRMPPTAAMAPPIETRDAAPAQPKAAVTTALQPPSTRAANAQPVRTGAPPRASSGQSLLPGASASGQGSPTRAPGAAEPERAPGEAAAQTEYAKAHLQELLKRRRQNQPPEPTGPVKFEPVRNLRHAQELLRDQHYGRAEEVLRELAAADPQNDVLRAYHLWSRMRAQPEADDSHVGELTDLAKKLVQNQEHTGFASYVLGHLYLSAKKDDLAEKYFRRAHAADRGHKDAERHLLILERRKQQASEADAAGGRKIFGIAITAAKPKS